MVYSKKTWMSNEVITTAALNNIEGGVEDAYDWSNEIIDADKDMLGYDLSNIGRIDASNNCSVDAATNLKLDLGNDNYSGAGIVASFIVAPILCAGSVLRIKAVVTAGSVSGHTHQLQIKHGSDVLASGTILTATQVDNFNKTITVTGAWQIDFYMNTTGGGTLNDKEVHCQMPDEFVEV